MDHRIDPNLRASLPSLLAPAEGLESVPTLFSTPPIAALEILSELGPIARSSFEPLPREPSTEPAPALSLEAQAAALEANAMVIEPTQDSRLIDALMEYHRLRSPARGAKSSPILSAGVERADRTQAPSEKGFSSMEIPVVENYVPKTSTSPYRSNEATRSVLKSKLSK